MEYIELGEVFKINVNDKTVYLKVEIDNSQTNCDNCYFYENNISCNKVTNCSHFITDINIIYKQINPIQDIFVIFGIKVDGGTKQFGAYPNEKDAKKKVEELNKHNINFAHYYEKIQYYPYGIITDIKEVKIN
jgi:hypothetical protein